MTRRTTLGMACLLALMLPALASAQSGKATIYKWTDADGKVHFSQQPPPDQTANVEVQRKNRTEPGDGTAAAPAAKPATPAAATAAAEEEAKPQKDPAICEKARNNLEQLRDRRFVVVRDEYGEESILSEERVAQEIQRAETAVGTHCD